MGNFSRGGGRPGGGFNRGFDDGKKFGGPKSFGGGSRFGGRSGGRPTMHQATCSECGANCELPFRPSGDRPVYCSNCFGKQQDNGGGGGRSNSFSGERRERPRFEDKQMHDAVCSKCGGNCQVPFRPVAGKPVFCSNCFDKGGSGSKDSGGAGVAEQIKLLNAKIDKLIKILAPNAPVEKYEKPEVKKEAALEEVVKEKKEVVKKIKISVKKVKGKKK